MLVHDWPLPNGTMSACWMMGGKDPRAMMYKGHRNYAYWLTAGVLNATALSYDDVIRHLCHNRNYVWPEHLVIVRRHWHPSRKPPR